MAATTTAAMSALSMRCSVAAAAVASAASPARAAFSTSASAAAVAKKSTPVKKKVAIKKKSGPSGPRGEGGRRKGGGEAGASPLRASEWSSPKPDMSQLSVLEAESAAEHVGTVVAFNDSTLSALQQFGTPKQWGLALARQPRPRTLLRPQSLALFKDLDASAQDASALPTSVVHGPRGAGASTLLIHSVSHALDQRWLVFYMPSLISLINSTSAYVYDPKQRTYLQPLAAQQILRAFGQVNERGLANVKVDDAALEAAHKAASAVEGASSGSNEASSSTSSSSSTLTAAAKNLHSLTMAGASESCPPQLQQIILETVLRSLVSQSSTPVLVAMDDFQALYSASRYRDPDYRRLDSYELAVPRALLQILRARRTAPSSSTESSDAARSPSPWILKRGAILGALSQEHSPLSYPAVATELYTALGLGAAAQRPNPFVPLNRVHLKHVQESNLSLRNVMSRELKPSAALSEGLQKDEAGALFSCIKQERGIFSPANDELFLSKLIESGGIPGTFERGVQRTLM
ncbi:hypothetical protein A4X09_0g5791 [Tilletia walkeri]|uniref:Small ribosomal subunit protein mS29 n=1 Tax=Tilletia walkeri TaxID=117179 RepID=A0A8X7N537_9BASI|nr:hypothetical protein A4X09_0g5791 [Tilletia walkeri]